jgi:hypothetical protein
MAESKKKMGGMKLGNFSGIKSEVQLEESNQSQEIVQIQELQEGEEIGQAQPEELKENQKPQELEQAEETKQKQTKVQFEAKAEPKLPDKITAAAPSPEQLKTSQKKKLAPVNIKLEDRQRVLLDEKARMIRSNNLEAVPAKDRVYPQHLIAVAIDLLLNSDIDWSEVKNIEQLREGLDLDTDI